MIKFTSHFPVALIGVIATVNVVQSSASAVLSPTEVNKIAEAITVRIEPKQKELSLGSGVIIQRSSNNYIVVTSAHVVKDQANYQIVTSDGSRYEILQTMIQKMTDKDIAIVVFTSTKTYKTAKIGNSDLALKGSSVYVSGFNQPSASFDQTTNNFVPGYLIANSSKDVKEGYTLCYNNTTKKGMSGGPVLNEKGELIGIHGRFDTQGDGDLLIPVGALGTPINPVLRWLTTIRIDPGVNIPAQKTVTQPQADDFFIQANNKYDHNDKQGAINAYTQAIKINPNYAEAYRNRGIIYYELGQLTKTIDDFSQSLKISPNDVNTYLARGIIHLTLKQYQAAKDDFDQALKINPNLAFAYFNRGVAYLYLEDRNQTKEDWERSLKLYQQEGNTEWVTKITDKLKRLK